MYSICLHHFIVVNAATLHAHLTILLKTGVTNLTTKTFNNAIINNIILSTAVSSQPQFEVATRKLVKVTADSELIICHVIVTFPVQLAIS